MEDVIFLTLEQVLVIHDIQIEKFGGDFGLRDYGLLESAIMRPQTTFGGLDLYPLLFDKAAALLHSLVLNHAFVDGNKRTGTACTLVFLELNKYQLKASKATFEALVMKTESKKLDINEISSWLKSHSHSL